VTILNPGNVKICPPKKNLKIQLLSSVAPPKILNIFGHIFPSFGCPKIEHFRG
jgi:hypothetical protein